MSVTDEAQIWCGCGCGRGNAVAEWSINSLILISYLTSLCPISLTSKLGCDDDNTGAPHYPKVWRSLNFFSSIFGRGCTGHMEVPRLGVEFEL